MWRYQRRVISVDDLDVSPGSGSEESFAIATPPRVEGPYQQCDELRRHVGGGMFVVGLLLITFGLRGLVVTWRGHAEKVGRARKQLLDDLEVHAEGLYEQAMRHASTESTRYEDSSELWVTQTFRREEIAQHMFYASCNGDSMQGSGIPTDFGGLWWMDGNPAPEDVASFGQGRWTPGLEGCRSSKVYHYSEGEKKRGTIKDLFGDEVPCRGRLNMDYFDERTWTWPYLPGVRELVSNVGLNMFVIEFVCGGEDPDFLTVCKVAVPSPGAKYMAKVFPTDYYMVRVDKTLWIRYTPTPLGAHQYYLKQITDCQGLPVQPHWHQFNSGGWSRPKFQKDVFGHGGDKRWFVKKVPGTLYVRVNLVAALCPRKVGTCSVFKACAKSRNAICQQGECFCGSKSHCERNGKCVSVDDPDNYGRPRGHSHVWKHPA